MWPGVPWPLVRRRRARRAGALARRTTGAVPRRAYIIRLPRAVREPGQVGMLMEPKLGEGLFPLSEFRRINLPRNPVNRVGCPQGPSLGKGIEAMVEVIPR